MSQLSNNDFVVVPISSQTYQAIAERYPTAVSTLIEDVINDFLERTSGTTSIAKENGPEGMLWSTTFLPKGTQLRTKYLGKYLNAIVSNGSALYEDQEFSSISKLANKMRGNTSVNAWLCIEVKRPTDIKWISANKLRS